MAETTTVRIYASDKKRIKEMAEATGSKPSDVVADLLHDEVAFECPECGDTFTPEEVDPETVREHGMLKTGVDNLVKGKRDVKDFDCPCCEEPVKPEDVDNIDASKRDRATREDIGVTSKEDKEEITTEEA
jgi:hypothetical protein